MKKSIMTLMLFVAIGQISFAQINKVETQKPELIGKIGALGDTWISCEKVGETYTFTYKDMKFQQLNEYKSFSFDNTDNAFESLYNMILEGLENIPEEDIKLELPNDIIWLKFNKSMGSSYVEIYHSVNMNPEVIGVSTWLNKKKLMKLFGKK